MPETVRPLFTTIEMEPTDPTRLRTTEGSKVWETVIGKRNRIEIGVPQCLPEREVAEGRMLTENDLNEFNVQHYSFYRLNLAITLVPDEGCRFRSADFIVDFQSMPGDQRFPLILRLKPSEHISQKKVIIEDSVNAQLSVAEPSLKVFSAELGGKQVQHTEVERIMVALESFGVRTQQAGWRFRLTDSREIPLSCTGLEALIVVPQNTRSTAQFRIVAKIDVLSPFDKWLTWVFKRKESAEVKHSFEIPPE